MAEVFEPKNMVGYLFKNDMDVSPDYGGHCTISGKQYYISAWLNKTEKGIHMRLVFRPKSKNQLPIELEDIPF